MSQRAADYPPAPAELAAQLRHRPGCATNDARAYIGRQGDVIVRCATCAYYWIAKHIDPATIPQPENKPPAPRPLPMRWSMSCSRCGSSIELASAKPVVPLCPQCKDSAEAARVERARSGRAKAEARRRYGH